MRNEKALKRQSIIDRIVAIEDAIHKSKEYLENGAHGDWRGFRPLFARKVKDGEELPPHKDWVKNHFLPQMERALDKAEKLLERFS